MHMTIEIDDESVSVDNVIDQGHTRCVQLYGWTTGFRPQRIHVANIFIHKETHSQYPGLVENIFVVCTEEERQHIIDMAKQYVCAE